MATPNRFHELHENIWGQVQRGFGARNGIDLQISYMDEKAKRRGHRSFQAVGAQMSCPRAPCEC